VIHKLSRSCRVAEGSFIECDVAEEEQADRSATSRMLSQENCQRVAEVHRTSGISKKGKIKQSQGDRNRISECAVG
jgi:PBP1b-binding outer membrane lipoprotein LpoB